MKQFDEKFVEQLSAELNKVEIPEKAIDHARTNGYNHFRKRKRKNRIMTSGFVAAAILTLFITSIRISPAFAETIAKIPGLKLLVEKVAYDKGIKDIIENEYYEELTIVQTKNDITFTLLGLVADETGMILSYKVEAPFDISNMRAKDINLFQNNKDLSVSHSYEYNERESKKFFEEKVEIYFEDIDYTNPSFELKIMFDDKNMTGFSVPFTLENTIAKTKVYPLNEKVVIDEQTIIIEELKISPLRAEVRVTVDAANTMQVMQLKEIKLLDEDGEEWGKIKNGWTASGSLLDGEERIYIQSNYFREPKSLTIKIEKIEALPKEESYVEVDFTKKKVIKIPDILDEKDYKVEVLSGNRVRIKYPQIEENISEVVSSASGIDDTIYYSGNSSILRDENFIQNTMHFDIPENANPVRLRVNSFPNYLDGSIEVKVPLEK